MSLSTTGVDGANDFNFLIGEWSVPHRHLRRRLVGDTQSIEFTGRASARAKVIVHFRAQ